MINEINYVLVFLTSLIYNVNVVCLSQEAALKTFHISDDPKNYYVTEVSDHSKGKFIIVKSTSI